MKRVVPIFGPFLVILVLSAPAQAAFPGANGKIAFSRTNNDFFQGIYSVNPDGTQSAALTNDYDFAPAWSPDGTKIAFWELPTGEESPRVIVMNADGSGQTALTGCCNGEPAWSPDGAKIVYSASFIEIFVMNADGTNQVRLTNNSIYDSAPAWSPDGNKIAFVSDRDDHPNRYQIYVMNVDGSAQIRLTNNSSDDRSPSWSPDGTKLAFTRKCHPSPCSPVSDIWSMNADGSGQAALTNDSAGAADPAWSPDGRQIAFASKRDGNSEIYLMNADGTNQSRLTNHFYPDDRPDWQRLPITAYEHPQGATQLNVSLVPAFKPCGTGGNPSNAKHAPPLATNSCNPPKPSVLAAVGATSQSSAQMTVVPGDTDPTNGNQANVAISASLTDIQSTAGGDYNPNASGPDLTAVTRIRLTDKANGYGGLPATATEYDFKVPIDCSSTPDPSVGSTCSANTTANTLLPGLIQEQRQTVVQAFRVRVDDSGANGIRGDNDDRIFATQGIFVP